MCVAQRRGARVCANCAAAEPGRGRRPQHGLGGGARGGGGRNLLLAGRRCLRWLIGSAGPAPGLCTSHAARSRWAAWIDATRR